MRDDDQDGAEVKLSVPQPLITLFVVIARAGAIRLPGIHGARRR